MQKYDHALLTALEEESKADPQQTILILASPI